MARHTRWVAEHKLQETDPQVYVHEVLSELFEVMLCYDMLDGSNLAVAERMARWYQDIEGTHEKEEAKGASDPYVSGLPRAGGGAAYCPELKQYVTDQVGKDVAILKEKRKAKEERELRRKK